MAKTVIGKVAKAAGITVGAVSMAAGVATAVLLWREPTLRQDLKYWLKETILSYGRDDGDSELDDLFNKNVDFVSSVGPSQKASTKTTAKPAKPSFNLDDPAFRPAGE